MIYWSSLREMRAVDVLPWHTFTRREVAVMMSTREIWYGLAGSRKGDGVFDNV